MPKIVYTIALQVQDDSGRPVGDTWGIDSEMTNPDVPLLIYTTPDKAKEYLAWLAAHFPDASSTGTPTPPPAKTYPRGTNQEVINLFYRVAGVSLWQDWMARAGLDVNDMHAHALVGYSGPAVEDMTGLTQEERDSLIKSIRSA